MKPALEEPRIVVVDDDREMRDSLSELLAAAGWRYEVLNRAETVAQRLPLFEPDVVLTDVRMPGMSGLDLLRSLDAATAPPIVLISAHGDIPMAVEAMQQGAYSFLEKPFDPRRLLNLLRNAAQQHRLRQDAERLRERLAKLSGLDRIMLGETEEMQALREEVVALSDSDVTLLLLGETGSGKELVARALHDLSPRAAMPFVAVNCASVPTERFEATMFGTQGGPKGLFQQADQGTLFLDEIAALSLAAQAKLLRAIETREVLPLGGEEVLGVDLRILSASNEDLETAVAERRFREDLFYRLNAVILRLPALRDRRGDVPLLYDHFVRQAAETYEIQAPETMTDDVAQLLSHDWPGNVRELRHVAERRVLAARRGRGSAAEAIRGDDSSLDIPATLREAVAGFERQLIAKAIKAHSGRMDAVAEALGIGRRTLNEKIVKLGLDKASLL